MTLSEKRKVLLISYLFPPLGGSGSLRPLKMAKYLPIYDWLPVVLTVKNPDWYYANDPELLKELSQDVLVFRAPMIRASWIYRCLNPFKVKIFDRLICEYLIHPDEQIGWLPFAYRSAIKLIKKNKISAIYSTSGPLTCHLIALLVKRRLNIPWIAEFRDEWFEAPNLPLPTKLHKKLHYRLEELIVTEADRIVTMAPAFSLFLMKHGVSPDKLTTIPAGFDPEDFRLSQKKLIHDRPHFTIVFVGLIYETFPPDRFLSAVNALIAEGKIPAGDLRIRFVGANTVVSNLDPFGIVECTGFIPRTEAIAEVLNADLLLLLLSRERGQGVIPSKVFEYMASGRPILALIPPEGAVAEIIERTKTGTVVDFDDFAGIKRTFLNLYQHWKTASLTGKPDWSELNQFDQTRLFREIADILDKITGTGP